MDRAEVAVADVVQAVAPDKGAVHQRVLA